MARISYRDLDESGDGGMNGQQGDEATGCQEARIAFCGAKFVELSAPNSARTGLHQKLIECRMKRIRLNYSRWLLVATQWVPAPYEPKSVFLPNVCEIVAVLETIHPKRGNRPRLWSV